MALIIPGASRCAICNEILQKDQRLVATTHFIGEKTDPLWRYSDAPFHYDCFQTWDLREAFVKRYNEVAKRIFGRNHEMNADGTLTD